MQNQNPYNMVKDPANGMARASKICSIIGLITFYLVFPGLILGSLGIILGLLSRGGRKKLNYPAKAGVIIGAVTLVITIVVSLVSVYIVIQHFGSWANYLNNYQDLLNQYSNGAYSQNLL